MALTDGVDDIREPARCLSAIATPSGVVRSRPSSNAKASGLSVFRRAPKYNAERFVPSIKEERPGRMLLLGERHFGAQSRNWSRTITRSETIKESGMSCMSS